MLRPHQETLRKPKASVHGMTPYLQMKLKTQLTKEMLQRVLVKQYNNEGSPRQLNRKAAAVQQKEN